MLYQWDFRPYRRRFKQALQTSYGSWSMREGLILRLVDETGNVGWGEIAPLPWFGSETIEQALAFCHQLPAVLSNELILSIPDALPCCQFAFECAWEGMRAGMRAGAIGKIAPQRRSGAKNQVSFETENSPVQAQNSDIEALNSTLRLQHSNVATRNSDTKALNSTLRLQISDPKALNSTLRPQNSTLRPQNSDIEAQSSERQAQNSKRKLYPTPHTPHPTPYAPSPPYSALLPAGKTALHIWKALWEQGFRTFKWKIGVSTIATELEILHSLTHDLPKTAKLRLDANGGLSLTHATQWLQACDAIAANPTLSVELEYMEQPLPIAQFQTMQALSQRYMTPIALDESVATLQQLQTCYKNGWRGIFVIKPAIVGSPSRLRQFCQTHAIDAVFSSVFETAIGRQAGLLLAKALGNPDRALGYGTTHWFDDADLSDFEQLWQTL